MTCEQVYLQMTVSLQGMCPCLQFFLAVLIILMTFQTEQIKGVPIEDFFLPIVSPAWSLVCFCCRGTFAVLGWPPSAACPSASAPCHPAGSSHLAVPATVRAAARGREEQQK